MKNTPGCEVDHLPPSSSDVKKMYSYTCSPLMCLHNMEMNNIAFYCLKKQYKEVGQLALFLDKCMLPNCGFRKLKAVS
jgi:hypothetical protein